MNIEKMILDNRTVTDGSLLLIPKDCPENPDLEHYLLTTKQKETILNIISVAHLSDYNNIISIKEIAAALGLKDQTFRNRLRSIREKNNGLLNTLPFGFSDGSYHPKVHLEKLSILSKEDFFLRNPSNPATSSAEKVVVRSNSNALLDRNRTNKANLQKHGMSLPNVNANLPVVRHMGNSPIEQLVNDKVRRKGKYADPNRPADKEQGKEFTIRTRDGRNKKILTRISSRRDILDPEDLQVLYAVYSLIYAYHRDKIKHHIKAGTLPKNLTPVSISHIVKMIGRGKGGGNFDFVRDCLQAIKDTSYDFLGLADIELDDYRLLGYAEMTYKNFTQCIPLTDKGPEIDKETDKIVFGKDATVYVIELPDHIFKQLITETTLFSFPKNGLAVPAILFSIYLKFRSLVKGNEKKSFTLRQISRQMNGHKDNVDRLIKSIKAASGALLRKKLQDDHFLFNFDKVLNEVSFNLWGYHGVISFKEEFLTVTCHEDEMLHCCGASPDMNSPLIVNEVAELYHTENFNKMISKKMASVVPRRFKKFSIIYGEGHNTFELHKYIDTETIDALITRLAVTYGCNDAGVAVQVETDIKSIEYFTLFDKELDSDTFENLLNKFNLSIATTPYLIDLILRLNRRYSIHEELFNVAFNGIEPTMKLQRTIYDINELLKKSYYSNPLNSMDENDSVDIEDDSDGIEDADFYPVYDRE